MKGISGLISALKTMDEKKAKTKFKIKLKQNALYSFWFYTGLDGYGPWGF